CSPRGCCSGASSPSATTWCGTRSPRCSATWWAGWCSRCSRCTWSTPGSARCRPSRHARCRRRARSRLSSPRGSEMARRLVVVGGGMVAQRLVEALRARDETGIWEVTVLAEEASRPYDRVALTSYFSARDAEELTLGDPALWDDPLVTLHRDCAVTSIDREARTVTDRLGRVHAYDELVLATGSSAAMPPIP